MWLATSIRLDSRPLTEALFLLSSVAERSSRRIRFFLNIIIALLSVILALLSLDPTLLLYYFISLSIIAAAVLVLRTRLLTSAGYRKPEPPQETLLEPEEETYKPRTILLVFLMSIVALILPLLLAKVLDPYIWFILILSSMTGVSTAEILFYLYTR